MAQSEQPPAADDIYYNIVPSEELEEEEEKTDDDAALNATQTADNGGGVDATESYYTDEAFLFNNLSPSQWKQSTINTGRNNNNNNNNNTDTDNSVYQTIVQAPQSAHQPLKRDFVMREILNTEENFLEGLKTLMYIYI